MAVLTFGEIMLRVNPPGFLRFRQAMPGSVDVTFAGAEVEALMRGEGSGRVQR